MFMALRSHQVTIFPPTWEGIQLPGSPGIGWKQRVALDLGTGDRGLDLWSVLAQALPVWLI